jgi:hypothetical protein
MNLHQPNAANKRGMGRGDRTLKMLIAKDAAKSRENSPSESSSVQYTINRNNVDLKSSSQFDESQN